ncbi:MAG: tRNA (adenosine(37)-N6)-dimethylallyltransferase MiaA [Cryobacterium sp.]|nr:tRNA (adenosine(37)-N6)-dimethylallyltransferase MiaA [Cryobacterium sp.]
MTLPLLAIVGATGTGKSELSLDLAEELATAGHPAEIINGDAMQLYRGMDIGTAKVPKEERRGIPHQLLDVLDVTEESSVADYQTSALAAIEDIRNRGATPILVGGSGLYVSSVLFDFRFPGTDAGIRARWEAKLAESGPRALFDSLSKADPEAANAIGPHNARRIIRALEVIELTGRPFGSGLPDDRRTREPTIIMGLRAPREALVARLGERVRGMWRAGLIREVRGLLDQGLERGTTALSAIGYAQALSQMRGELSEDDAVDQAFALTRRYARRQVGWFRRYPNTHWFEHDEPDRVRLARALALGHA